MTTAVADRSVCTQAGREDHRALPSSRIAALDGLRAIAVVMVVVYHLHAAALPGGFIGVDIFFCLSGYVVTRRLLQELTFRHTISVRRFWAGRCRRLLPSLVAVVATCAVATAAGDSNHLRSFRMDAVTSLLSVSNWWYVYGGRSYFDETGRPPVLRHTWSLSIEEQFYTALPIVVLLVAARCCSWSQLTRRLQVIAAGAAIVSMAAMSVGSFLGGVPFRSDGSSLYFGTGSHAFGVLLGVALACTQVRRGWVVPIANRRRALVVGCCGVALLLVSAMWMAQPDRGIYMWQLQAVAVVATATIAAAASSPSLGRLLSVRPLVWIGARSYAIYLWHWPVVVFLTPQLLHTSRALVIAVQIAVTLLLSSASYRLLEQQWRRRAEGGHAGRRNGFAPSVMGLGIVSAAGVVAAFLPASSMPSTMLPSSAVAAPHSAGTLSAYGDSVLVGSWPQLSEQFPGLSGYAREGMAADDVFTRIKHDHDQGKLANTIFILTGNNGYIEPDSLNDLLDTLGDKYRVLLAVPKVDRGWDNYNVRVIRRAAASHHNVTLIDWRSEVDAHPSLLWPDGLHARPEGGRALAQLIAHELSAR